MTDAAPDDGGVDEAEGAAGRSNPRLFGRRSALRTPAEALQPQMAPPPPVKRKRKRRGGILSVASGVLSFVLVTALVATAVVGYARRQFLAAGPLTSDKVVFIAPHTSTSDIVDQLEREGVVANAFVFNAAKLAYGKHGDIKAGEYFVQARASSYDVMSALTKPKPQQVSVTLNGQMTVPQLVQLVDQSLAPGPLASDKSITVAQGARTSDIVDQLAEAGIIDDVAGFDSVLAAFGKRGKLKPGDYVFKPHVSPFQVMSALVAGPAAALPPETAAQESALPDHVAFVQRAITLPEGLTSEQIVQRLKDAKDEDGNVLLSGDVHVPREGTLMPDTYFFTRGDSRESIIKEMDEEQKKVLNDTWTGRAPDLPFKSALELVTLASIVEKETGKAEERPRVAGVYVNRLMRHMKLQSDPTIIYGLVGGKGTLGRPILASEIRQSTPYNTYVIDGLPPGPICNPGRAALQAAANPMKTKELYFVADGTGGHAFAETAEDHLKNVARWREIEKDAKDKAPPEADKPAPAKPQQKTELEGGVGTAPAVPAAAQPAASGAVKADAAAAGPTDVLALSGYKVKIGPAIDGLGWQMPGTDLGEGVNDAAFRDDDEPLTPGRLASYPLSPGRLADLRARAARWGVDPGASDKLPPDLLVAQPDRAAAQAPCHSVALAAGVRPKGIDASEGTALDPLRNRTFDLNSPKLVPTEAVLLAAIAQAAAPSARGTARRSQVFRSGDGVDKAAASDDCRPAPVIEAAAAPAPAARLAWNAGPESPRPEADAAASVRSRAVDASAGTNLDPLLNTTYDLNSPHTVPSKPVPLDGSDKPVRPSDGSARSTQVASASVRDGAAAPVQIAAAAAPLVSADPATRGQAFDASEGTRLDPLRNKTYDLNSPQVVPSKPLTFDETDILRPADRPPKPVQLASAGAMTALPAIPPDSGPASRAFDASEGTRLDPLLNKTYDLNSPQVVPSKPLTFDGLDKPSRAQSPPARPIETPAAPVPPAKPAATAAAAPVPSAKLAATAAAAPVPPPKPVETATAAPVALPKPVETATAAPTPPARPTATTIAAPTPPARPVETTAAAPPPAMPVRLAYAVSAQSAESAQTAPAARTPPIFGVDGIARPRAGDSTKPAPATAVEKVALLEPPANTPPPVAAALRSARTASVAPPAAAPASDPQPAKPSDAVPKAAESPAVAQPPPSVAKVGAVVAAQPEAREKPQPDLQSHVAVQSPAGAADVRAAQARPATAAKRSMAALPPDASYDRSLPTATIVAIEPPRVRPVRVASVVVAPAAMPRALLPSPPASPLTDTFVAPGVAAPAGPPPIPLAALPAPAGPRVVLASPWSGAAEAKPAAEPTPAAEAGKASPPIVVGAKADTKRDAIAGPALAAIRPVRPRAPVAATDASAERADAGARRRPPRRYDLDKNFDLNSAKVIPDL